MKKVLTLILVLGMASAASAALQISVHPTTQDLTWDPLEPAPTDITIAVSDELLLDIYTDAAIPNFASDVWALVVDTTQGDISGGVAAVIPSVTNMINGLTVEAAAVIPPTGMEGIWGLIANFSGADVAAGTVIADQILFHCEAPGDAVVQLYHAPDGVPITEADLYDTVVIHQIPEPMTMALLGLGGLALIRRRK